MNRFTMAVAGGALAIGVLSGAAGAIVVGSATDDGLAGHHEQMGPMMPAMSGSGMGPMMQMMGGDGSWGPSHSQHAAHHPDTGR